MPILGEAFDLVNAGISLARGDYLGAALSLGAAIPFAGWVAGGANLARTGVRAVGTVSGLASSAGAAIRSGRGAVSGIRNALRRGGGCNSFAAATLVLMADGSQKPIGDVRVGDWVLATDPEIGETRPRQVTGVIVGTGAKQLVRVVAGGREITATDEHPFYTAGNRAFTDAADLEQGDLLLGADGSLVRVSALIDADQTTTVYNLTVDADHTYYAGQQPLLVHNCKKTVGELRGAGEADAHHVIQDAAVRDVPGYKTNAAPGVRLDGPSTAPGTPHYDATQAQRSAGVGGTYGAQRQVACMALAAAGCSRAVIQEKIAHADEYFMGELGLTLESPLRIPGNRRMP